MSTKTTTPHPATSLRAIAESDTGGVTKSTTFRVDPNKIKFEKGFNLREENDELELHITRLETAMLAGAFVPPVDVQIGPKGEILARDGHCRTKAAQRVKKKMPDFTLECRQLRGNDADAVLHMLGTGSGQKALTPLEQGRGFLRLINMGLKPTDIADRLGISRVTVDNNLTLAEAPAEVQQLISTGVVSSTTAREAIKLGPEAIEALKKAVADADTNPAPANKSGKKSTKKKVTAKKLRGTAADKSKKKKKAKKEKNQTVAEWNKELGMSVPVPTHPAAEGATFTKSEFLALGVPTPEPTPPVAEGEIVVKVKKEQAQSALDFLKANAPEDDTTLKEFTAALEMVLM